MSTADFNFGGNISALATRLVHYNGCDTKQKRKIYSGWQQSWKIMNLLQKEAKTGINFNEGAAIEYLAPPLENEGYQGKINSKSQYSL